MDGTFAEGCLNELCAIELFEGKEWKTFQNDTYTLTRQYLSHEKRQILSMLPLDTLSTYFQPGELIHVPMLPEEESTIIQMRRLGPNISFEQIAKILPGRTADHVKMYISDHENNTIGREYLYLKDDMVTSAVCPQISCESKHWVEKLSKQFSVISLHGAVNAIACRNNAENSRVMIGCCTIDALEYNRNELMLIARQGRNDFYKAYELDGHYTELRDRRVKRETVTSIAYDAKSDTFISAGYDGRVLAWDAEWGSCIAQLGAHNSRVNTIACHAKEKLVCYGLQSGSVHIAKIPEKNSNSNSTSRLLMKMPVSDHPDMNTVDWLALPSSGRHTNYLYVGIGHLQSLHGGVAEVWDMQNGMYVNSSETIGQGLTCMNVSKCGKFLAAGSGCILDGVRGDGIIRVFSTDSHLQSGIKIRSKMFDIDSVSFCPQSKLLFVSETSDSSVALYDLRYVRNTIFTTRHANKSDEIVCHAWIDGGNILATGGNDQTVKIWDCSRSFELLETFHFNMGISCIECNEVDKSIWVGTDNGEVTMIGIYGLVNESQPRELEGIVTF